LADVFSYKGYDYRRRYASHFDIGLHWVIVHRFSNYLSGAEDDIEKVIVQDGVCGKFFSLLVGAIPLPLHNQLNYWNFLS